MSTIYLIGIITNCFHINVRPSGSHTNLLYQTVNYIHIYILYSMFVGKTISILYFQILQHRPKLFVILLHHNKFIDFYVADAGISFRFT